MVTGSCSWDRSAPSTRNDRKGLESTGGTTCGPGFGLRRPHRAGMRSRSASQPRTDANAEGELVWVGESRPNVTELLNDLLPAARLYLRSRRRIAPRAIAPASAARAPITSATGTGTVSPARDSKMKPPRTPAEVSNTQMSIGRAKTAAVGRRRKRPDRDRHFQAMYVDQLDFPERRTPYVSG